MSLHDWLLDLPGGATGTRLRLALSEWPQGVGWLLRSCRFMSLEVDASRRVGDCLPSPAVFLIPLLAGDADTDIDHGRNAFHRDPEELVSALAQLVGARPDPAVAAELRRMLGLVPNRAELLAAGVMLSRPTFSAPRIAVPGLRASELAKDDRFRWNRLLDALVALGWRTATGFMPSRNWRRGP